MSLPDLPRLLLALELSDHALPPAKWAALLLLACPREYADRPLPRPGRIPLSEKARIAFYQLRARAGLSLFHPADTGRADEPNDYAEELHLSRGASRLRNGAVSRHQPLVESVQ